MYICMHIPTCKRNIIECKYTHSPTKPIQIASAAVSSLKQRTLPHVPNGLLVLQIGSLLELALRAAGWVCCK